MTFIEAVKAELEKIGIGSDCSLGVKVTDCAHPLFVTKILDIEADYFSCAINNDKKRKWIIPYAHVIFLEVNATKDAKQ